MLQNRRFGVASAQYPPRQARGEYRLPPSAHTRIRSVTVFYIQLGRHGDDALEVQLVVALTVFPNVSGAKLGNVLSRADNDDADFPSNSA